MQAGQLRQQRGSTERGARCQTVHAAALLRPAGLRHAPFTSTVGRPCQATIGRGAEGRRWSRVAPSVLVVRASSAEDTGLTPGHPYPWEEDYDELSNKIKEVTDELSKDLRGCNIWLVRKGGRGEGGVLQFMGPAELAAMAPTDADSHFKDIDVCAGEGEMSVRGANG